jgi:hypothetical protein
MTKAQHKMTKKCRVPPFDQTYLKSILEYNPDTGLWKWIIRKCGVAFGSRAGLKVKGRHRTIGINRVHYRSARLAWLYMTGEFPITDVDHKNRIRDDDRWCNLRLATFSQNVVNSTRKARDLPRGVVHHGKNYQAQTSINNKHCYLGTFKTPEEAHEAYLKASEFRKEFLP